MISITAFKVITLTELENTMKNTRQKNLAKKERELRQDTNTKVKAAERQRDREIKNKQEYIQFMSVFLP